MRFGHMMHKPLPVKLLNHLSVSELRDCMELLVSNRKAN